MQYAFVALDNAPYRTGVAVSLLQKHEPILLVADAFDTSRANQFLSYIDCRLFKATVLETRRLRNQLHGESIEDMRYVCPHLSAQYSDIYTRTTPTAQTGPQTRFQVCGERRKARSPGTLVCYIGRLVRNLIKKDRVLDGTRSFLVTQRGTKMCTGIRQNHASQGAGTADGNAGWDGSPNRRTAFSEVTRRTSSTGTFFSSAMRSATAGRIRLVLRTFLLFFLSSCGQEGST